MFTDGTTEEVEAVGLVIAWIKGKIRAREKRTWLLKVIKMAEGIEVLKAIEDSQQKSKKTFEELKEEGFFWKLEPNESIEQVEPKVRDLVEAINKNDWIATYSSCQGHTKPPIFPYISFYAKAEKGLNFLECISGIPSIIITKKWREVIHPKLRESLSPKEEVIGAEFWFDFERPLEPRDYEEVIRCLGWV